MVAANCRGNEHIEIAVTGPDTLYCVYADDESDVQGNRMPSKTRQMYGRHVKVERLSGGLRPQPESETRTSKPLASVFSPDQESGDPGRGNHSLSSIEMVSVGHT